MAFNGFFTGKSEDNPVPEKLTVNPCPPLDSIFMALGPRDDDLSGSAEMHVNFTVVDDDDISMNNTVLPLPQYGKGVKGRGTDIPATERIRLMAKAVATDMDLHRKRESERIHTEGDMVRAKNRADIQSLREMKKVRVDIGPQGDISISVELFGGDKEASAPFYVGCDLARYTCPGKKGEILAIPVVFRDGETRTAYLDLQSLNAKSLNRMFDRMGIRFGYSSAKEAEIRALFLNAVVQKAPSIELPPQHGFWRHDGEWDYAMPEDLTAKEVWSRV